MHTVMWTFHVPEGTSKQDLVNTINASAHTYLGIPGLVRKYYGIAQDGKTIVGIYLWKSEAASGCLSSPQWVAMVTERWGSVPTKQEWSTPDVVESEGGKLLTP